jgi:hypothetical protein
MDDNNIQMLKESQSEWGLKLLRVILPHITDGVYAMFAEGKSICDKTEEQEKYLMTFQNILSRVPKWNNEIVLKETKRIQEESGCTYLEDLITCVHIAHLKMLSSVRTGKTQKKIEINIPKLPIFVHSVYINISRELYTNVYLFDPNLSSLHIQKNKEKVKEIVRQTILNTIRDNIPIEQLLRAYLDETTELMDEPKKPKKEDKSLRFSETNMAMSIDNEESVYEPPDNKVTIMEDCQIKVDDLTPAPNVVPEPVVPEVQPDPVVEFLQIESLAEPKEPPEPPKEPEIVLDIEELN